MSAEPPWYDRWFDALYLETYSHRDAAEAERGTTALLEPLGLAGRRVLDVGCGDGRWSRAVAARGAIAVGVDRSWDLLRAARDAGLAALVRADMRALPIATGVIDLVLCMFTTFGYFASAEEDRGALSEMGRVLRPGGRLVLDVLNPAAVRRGLVPESHRTAGRFEVHERRRLEEAGRRLVKEITLTAGGSTRRYREEVRLWDPQDLAAALAAEGLEPETRWGDYAAAPFASESSPRLIQLARRRA